jgi:hypothetical protein
MKVRKEGGLPRGSFFRDSFEPALVLNASVGERWFHTPRNSLATCPRHPRGSGVTADRTCESPFH